MPNQFVIADRSGFIQFSQVFQRLRELLAQGELACTEKPTSSRKELKKMQQTQQLQEFTIRDSLLLGISKTIEYLEYFQSYIMPVLGIKSAQPILGSDVEQFTAPLDAQFVHLHNIIKIDYSHYTPLLYDTYGGVFRIDTYSDHMYVRVAPYVARNPAVIDKLEDLFGEMPELRKIAYSDFEDHVRQNWVGNIPPRSFVDSLTIEPQQPFSYAWLLPQIDIQPVTASLDTPLWKVREAARMACNQYDPLPDEVLKVLPREVVENQFPHMAVKEGNAGMIAFTQSPTAGVLDRQQVMRPGRYIRQHCPNLTDQQVKELSAACLGALTAGFHHSTKAEDYARVYINGPSSCMSYGPDDDDWCRLMVGGKFFHPCSIYAHPENDLELVWLEVNKRIVARAVVNKATKQYPRAYGSDSVADSKERMERYLRSLGYTRDHEALAGQKVLKVHPDDYPGAIICPYIDCNNVGVSIRDNHMIIKPGGLQANHETGCLYDYDINSEPGWYCECCGNGFSDDDRWEYDQNDNRICEGCAYEVHTVCQVGGQTHRYVYVHGSETIHTDRTPGRGGGYVWMDGYSEHFGYVELSHDHYEYEVADADYCVYCPDRGDYILRDDAGRLGYVIDGDDAYEVDTMAVLDGELVARSDIDDGIHERVYGATNDYHPDLPVYVTREQEEAA